MNLVKFEVLADDFLFFIFERNAIYIEKVSLHIISYLIYSFRFVEERNLYEHIKTIIIIKIENVFYYFNRH